MKKQILSMLTGLLIGTTLFAPQLTQAAGMVAEPTWQPIYVDGKQVAMEAYNIAGHNYVKLRDIGSQVGFNVYWSSGVQIDTGNPYTGVAPENAGIRVSSYKGDTLLPGERSGLNISPSSNVKSVVSTCSNVVRVEKVSGFWTAIAVASGSADVIVTDADGHSASLTLTVHQPEEIASAQNIASQDTDAIRQELIERINQVRRENGVSELSVNQSLMDAAQYCSSLHVTYHQNKVECKAVAAAGYPHGFGSNITAFTSVPSSKIAQRAVENWINSPGHFQTMIDPACDAIGVGITDDDRGTVCFMFVGNPSAINPSAINPYA